jgi:parvulin-like peptidyl-prolyl isomerase
LKRYLTAAAAIALLAAACSAGSSAAATVNGTDISSSEVEGLVFETGEDFGDTEFTQLLEILVQWYAVADAAESEFAIDPTADEIAAEVDDLYAAQGAGLTFEDFLSAQNVSEAGLDLYAEQLLIGEAVIDELTPSIDQPTEQEAQQAYDEDPLLWTEVCAAHILVASADEADAVLERLSAGEQFAALALELSTDTGSGAAGGDLGCDTPARYVTEFADATVTAPIGEIVGPVETQFGFHVIRVDSRTEATIADVQTALFDERRAAVVDEWYVAAIAAAEVTIDEQWGTWETDPAPAIVPPAE